MGRQRLLTTAGARLVGALLVASALTSPSHVLAEHGDIHGYCKDGVPVVTEWPAKYRGKEHFQPTCNGNILGVIRTDSLAPGRDAIVYERPPDFDAWATVWLNGVRVINPYQDVLPYVVKTTGRTLVPIRMVTEAMGGTASWDDVTSAVTIRLGDGYMEMIIGNASAIANGQTVVLDQPPVIWKDRTMVPLRVIAEAFGATVSWASEAYRVDVDLEGVPCQPGYCWEMPQ